MTVMMVVPLEISCLEGAAVEKGKVAVGFTVCTVVAMETPVDRRVLAAQLQARAT